MTIACVLRSGGPYRAADVQRLQAAVRRHCPEPYRFVCLTDQPNMDGVRTIPLKQDWPGWWSKIALFADSSFADGERILYLDLDSLVTGDLTPLANFAGKGPNGRLIVLRDFYRPMHYGSGVMGFQGGQLGHIYERFKAEAHRHLQQSGSLWGDQQFIEATWPGALFWQDLLSPDTIVSYKVHCQIAPPANARVVCFHGLPRPWDVDVAWVQERWHRA